MNPEVIQKAYTEAEMIVAGYAFTRMDDSNIQILQLRTPHHALIMSPKGEVLETTMDDVELDIVKGYWMKNQKYMELAYA